MPRLIDYSARFDQVREASFAIVLRDGPHALTLPAIASELNTSISTLRRLLSSADLLPRLAYQWVDRRSRRRAFRDAPGELEHPADWALAVNSMLRLLPFDPPRADDARVRRAVLIHDAHRPWVDEATQPLAAFLRERSELAFADLDLPTDDKLRLALATRGLVTGTIHLVCDGDLAPDQAVPLVRDHVLGLRAACRPDHHRDAA